MARTPRALTAAALLGLLALTGCGPTSEPAPSGPTAVLSDPDTPTESPQPEPEPSSSSPSEQPSASDRTAPPLPTDENGRITASADEIRQYLSDYDDVLSEEEKYQFGSALGNDVVVEHSQEKIDLALEATKIMTTWVPAEDMNQTAAEMRARDLMTPELYESIVVPERYHADPLWYQATQENMVSVPSVSIDRHAAGDKVTVRASWMWQPVDGNGKTLKDNIERIYYFGINEVDGELKITDYDWQDLDPIANFRAGADSN